MSSISSANILDSGFCTHRNLYLGWLFMIGLLGFAIRTGLAGACATCQIFLPNISVSPSAASPSPGIPVSASHGEWVQDGMDAQRTGYTAEEPKAPFSFAWTWNGPDANGGQGGHWYDAPPEARVIVGNGKVIAPAGGKGLYGINLSNGSQAWQFNPPDATFVASAAYDKASKTVIAGATDGNVYQLNSDTGKVVKTYATGASIRKAVLIAGDSAYVVNEKGELHRIRISDLSRVWVYNGSSAATTPPAFSAGADVIIFGSADLNVHAVKNGDGSRRWRVKPTPNTPDRENSYEYGWPVVADKYGIVFIRMRLNHYSFTDSALGGVFPNSMNEIRAALSQKPDRQSLFALDVGTGAARFVPAVGYNAVEYRDPARNFEYDFQMGTIPVVKTFANGDQAVYMAFRSGQSKSPDYRWDGAFGEMALQDTSEFGFRMKAGDLRYVRLARFKGDGVTCNDCTGQSYVHVVDEGTPISVAGNMIIHSHWSAAVFARIKDNAANPRWNNYGNSFVNPIPTQDYSVVVRAQRACNDKGSDHSTTCGLQYFTDSMTGEGRWYGSFNAPGKLWWVYWNVADPPGGVVDGKNQPSFTYSAGFQARYTMVSNGYIIVQGNGGDLFVLKHGG
jgi:hypothetical protein